VLCACLTAKRLSRFRDSQTAQELSSFCAPESHVRTMDVRIIQHLDLRHALAQGLNHIPLRPTIISQAVATIMHGFEQLVGILDLQHAGFPVEEARLYLHTICLASLKAASKANKYGFRFSNLHLFDITTVKNETQWLLQNLYCSGLDKAANNACFICIKHISLMALERLMGSDFLPCKVGLIWTLPSAVLDKVSSDLKVILPEFLPPYLALPYLMATYKQHKIKYRWLTNAFHTVFSNIATLLTITSKVLLESVKAWALIKTQSYRSFLRVDTSIFWLVDSIIETTLNLPCEIHNIFVADICRCYETIPLQGPDNLLTAIAFLTGLAFKHAALAHPKATTSLWVRVATNGSPAIAQWATRCPQHGHWVEISQTRLLKLHEWLINNCFLTLGDRVWQQCTGIPMGFSCSPMWCNMYLLAYEIQFIQRLARLGRSDLLSKFKSSFRYIDDLCLINVHNPREFLSPDQPRVANNPFWIYPLDVLEIKEEISTFSQNIPDKGISAHFMNTEILVNEMDPRLYTFRKYDKRRNLPLVYSQYIKFHSNRAVHQAYNIAISQLLPILYISNSDSDAAEEIQVLIKTMCNNGFQQPRLLAIIKRFLSKGPFPHSQLDIQNLISAI
jgi:hypothetical protein